MRKGVFLGIQKCENCGYQFSWKEIQKAIRWTYKPLVCENCGTVHVITKRTSFIFSIFSGVVGFTLAMNYLPILVGIGVMLIILLLAIILFPYVAKYEIDNSH
ncbi:TIGR04104 family putative zinc finger protein [Halobacillus yeomjeoni]|uniref:TIGR04104 family putative zinc finger protein n=1 Tax=Halobacillus yeomjeoni TaxID=311194 RepID=UPI00399D75EB